jgi:Zn finger protein HypA/HybF involved in hydrogenase expression
MSSITLCDDARYDARPKPTCPICGRHFQPTGRRRYCTPACRQQAYRLRRGGSIRYQIAEQTASLRRDRRLVERTVYECGSCGERALGEYRCEACNLMMRKLGLGGTCPDCDQPITVAELLGMELQGEAAPA